MGKIIDKVRQREFDAMLNRKALERASKLEWVAQGLERTEKHPAEPFAFGGVSGGPDMVIPIHPETIQMRKWVDMVSYAPLSKYTKSG